MACEYLLQPEILKSTAHFVDHKINTFLYTTSTAFRTSQHKI
jgi:hypothetical protein